MKKKLLFFLMLCMSIAFVKAQNVTIKGKVTEKNTGAPIPGVQVTLKSNQKNVTTTDEKGEFSLNAPTLNAVLLVHAMGHKDIEVSTQGNSYVSVQMEVEIAGNLEEVIVAGAVVKKKDLTGSVASISAEKIAQTPTTSINQAMQGKLPGARITSSASPGADASIRVRGYNSMQYGTNPIYVVDGVIMESNFNTLNPNDIESLQVLKDASATAIYGSRGANGVVVVTTKKGKRGEGKISFDTWVGWQSFSKKMKLMSAEDLYKLRIDANANTFMEKHPGGNRQNYIDTANLFAQYEKDTYKQGKSYDWLAPVSQNGLQQNYNLGFSGGSDKGSYFFSLGYTDQQGLIKTSDYKRYSGRVNLEQNVKSWLKIGTNTSFMYSSNSVPSGNVFSNAINANPLLPVNDTMPWLMWANVKDQNNFNPIMSLSVINNNNMSRLISSNFISITPVKHVTIRSTFATNLMWQQNYGYTPSGTGEDLRNSYNGSASHYKAETYNWQWDNTASYSNSFGRSNLNAMIGTSLQKNISNYDQMNAYGFPNNDFAYMNMGAAYSKSKFSLGSDFATNTLVSYLARADYSFANKYFATATVRYDGSSKFASGHQWGAFPSIALGWDISKENFLADISWINKLKLRLGYGIAGNQNVPNFAYYTIYNTSYSAGATSYNKSDQMGNPDLKWEQQKQANVGVDFAVLNSRLNFTFDYFHILDENLLMLQTMAPTSGFRNRVSNVGALKNRGVEFSINYAAIRTKDIQWNIMANLSSDKNTITKMYYGMTFIPNLGGYTGVEVQRTGNYIKGESVNSIWGYKFDKIAQQSDMAYASTIDWAGRIVRPGDIMVKDLNGDKKIGEDDKTVLGKLDPKFYGGIGTDITYKGFSLNIFCNYNFGAKRISGFYEGMMSSYGSSISHVDMNNRWTSENPSTKYGRALAPMDTVIHFTPGDCNWGIQNASFFRLSNLTLAYNMPKDMLRHIFLDNVKVYVTGTNLLLISKDKGYDPETGDGFPNFKQVLIGLNIGL